MEITTNSEKETFALAEKYAKNLKGGEVIGLIGDLGAGKTVFAKGLAAGLGIKETVTSPTFVLMKVYKVRGRKSKIKTFVHIDAYRISNENDIINLGADEYLNRPDTVVLIEWADKIKNMFNKNVKIFNFKQN